MTGPRPSSRSRRAIISEWETSGRPPCPVCGLAFGEGGRFRVSMLWDAVVHPYCLYARVGRPSPDQLARGACSFYPGCPIRRGAREDSYCVCPVVAARNFIFVAARLGQVTVRVPSKDSPAVAEAARRAGLGQEYRGVPLRENPALMT